MKIEFIGLTNKAWGNNSLAFEYRVTIGKESTIYFTGIGWIEAKKKEGLKTFHVPNEYKMEFARVLKPFGRLTMYEFEYLKTVYRKEPQPSDVAECLLNDIESGSMSFDEFCDNLGYSNDSIKAF
jgi:hypothetical protein